MKKFLSFALAMVLCVGILSGCGTNYNAEESTVYVQKNGKIVSTDVEEFDTSVYDEAALKAYIDDAIDSYTSENGSGRVKLQSLNIEDNKATLIIEYASADDYTNFNGIQLFTGTIAEALASGYTFDGDFASISDGKAAACDASEFKNQDGFKVCIIRANTNLNVPGDIKYASVENVSLVDKKTAAIAAGNNLLGQAVASTESTTENATESVEEETTESVDDGSISEDELLEVGEEEQEIDFGFGDDSSANETTDTYTNVYTYVIYK